MSIDFSSFKKKKQFPFFLFGYALLLVWTGLILYLLHNGFSLETFLEFGPDLIQTNAFGFSILISSFLLYLLSLGIIREVKLKFKFPLYIMQFVFFISIAVFGYYLTSARLSDLYNYLMIAGALYHLILLTYLLLQHRVYSRYYSFTALVFSSLPAIPFLYGVYVFITGAYPGISPDLLNINNIAKFVLLFTLLLYTVVNSVYLNYINRKVF